MIYCYTAVRLNKERVVIPRKNVQKNTKEETKTRSMRPKLLKTLNMNQFKGLKGPITRKL